MPPKKKAAVSSPVPAAAALELKIVREFHLPPDVNFRFDVEKHVPKPLPTEVAPFDKKKCAENLKKIIDTKQNIPNWKWDTVPFAPAISKEEALLWLELLCLQLPVVRPRTNKVYLKYVQDFQFKAVPTLEKAGEMVKTSHISYSHPSTLFFILRNLYSIEEVLDFAFGWTTEALDWGYGNSDLTSFKQSLVNEIFTYAEYSTLKRVQDAIAAELKKPLNSVDLYNYFPLEIYFAPDFGFTDELEKVVTGFPNDHYVDKDGEDNSFGQLPQILIFGLSPKEKIVREMKRLRLHIEDNDYLDQWIFHTGTGLLDWVSESLVSKTLHKEAGAKLVNHLTKIVDHPDLAPLMLRLKFESKLGIPASKWIEEHPGNAIYGLLPLAGEKGKLAEHAIEFLRVKNKQGCTEFIKQSLADFAPEIADAVQREILDYEEIVYPPLDLDAAPKPLKKAFENVDEISKTKIPPWIAPEMLPPILIDKSALTPQQTVLLLQALKTSSFENPHPIVVAIKEFSSEKSRSAFVWKMFEIWLSESAPAKENWAMKALGFLGGDDAALKLTPLVRVWPGESQHKRAVLGLECLRAIGTDTALMQLNGISQKLKFQGLKKQAAVFMEEIAKSRGLTKSELEDRVVPDCELDEKGKRIFDFGARQFEFGLGPDLKPMVRGEDGKFKADLPKPNSKDDTEKAEEAIADWKRMKKQIREVVKIQSVRLEEAMIAGRSWSPDEFVQLLVQHPLMRHLVRLILWGIFDEQGKIRTIFRVTDESDFAGENDESVQLPDGVKDRIRVVHPLHLSDAQKQRWGEILSDYELIPPFAQLGREVYTLDSARKKETDLNAKPIGKMPGVSLAGQLDKGGWQRALPADGGGFYEHTKPFYGANISAVCQYDPGLFAGGGPEYWDEQTVTHFFFIPGIYSPTDWYPAHEKRLKLKDVDPIVLSECLAVLKVLESKTN